MDPLASSLIYSLDLFGTASFAFSGALRAVDRKPDFVGMLILAGATAVGGSIFRDAILDRPAVVFKDPGYAYVILFSVIVTFFFTNFVLKRGKLFQYFDAVGFGIYSAITATYAWGVLGYHPLSVILLASFTGCAGGVVRDLIIQKPTVVLSDELYLTPMIFGTIAMMLSRHFLGFGEIAGFFTAFGITLSLRLGAVIYDWRLPRVFLISSESGKNEK